MTCPFCASTRFNGSGELATCANPECAKFVELSPIAAAFARQRAGMSDAERAQEAATRERLQHTEKDEDNA